MLVTSVQLVVFKLEFSCNVKPTDGTIQDTMRFGSARAMFNTGAGANCKVQMPPPLTVATNLLPSAEQATADQLASGEPLSLQVAPEFVEVRIRPPMPNPFGPPAFTSVVPSAEHATRPRPRLPAGAYSQVAPEFVEMTALQEPPVPGGWNGSKVPATNRVPSADEALDTRYANVGATSSHTAPESCEK